MDHRAIVLADRSGAELAPLDQVACPALLEVAGKTVIEYTLEDLVESGFTEAVVVTSSVEAMRQHLRDGERWGIRLRYLLVRADSDLEASLARVSATGPVLVVRGDILRGRFVRRFLDAASGREGSVHIAVSEGRPAGAWWGCCKTLSTHVGGGSANDSERVEVGEVGLNGLDSLRDFHRACLAASRGELPGVRFNGREIGPGIHAGRLAKLEDVDVREGEVFAAEGAQIGRDVSVHGTVVVGSGALVDRGAKLEDSIVLPGSYVGRGVELKRAIVAGTRLIRVDLGAATEVTDNFLLASLDKPVWRPAMVSHADRMVGLLLLIVSAPLWPLALLASLFDSPGRPVASRRFTSNKSRTERPAHFTAWSWQTRVPVLAQLPALFAVAAGHLRLVGVRPGTPGQPDALRPRVPAGLVGPALLDVGARASDEERRLAETLFEGRLTRANQLTYLARAGRLFFSRRAWRGHQGHHQGFAGDETAPLSPGAPVGSDA